MDFLSFEDKERIAKSFANKKFKTYSGYDSSILFASVAIALFVAASPFIGCGLNGYDLRNYFRNTFSGVGIIVFLVLVFFLLVIVVQLIRINVINTGVCVELENGGNLLILNGLFHKRYVLGEKVYAVKKNEVVEVGGYGEIGFVKLVTHFLETNIYKIEKDKKIIFTAKLKDDGNCLDYYTKTALPEKFVRLIFNKDKLTKGTLSGSKQSCAVYFKFRERKEKDLKKYKIPESIIEKI